jgi:hypothetical protein
LIDNESINLKDILYIAFQFPPLNVGGSARPGKFVKYLRGYGINPVVVTLDPKDYLKVYPNPKLDSNILTSDDHCFDLMTVPCQNLLEKSKNKYRSFIEIFFSLHGSREKKYWEVAYHQLVDAFIVKNKVSAILVTAPPFGMLSLARETSEKHDLPLIVDMRDPWTLWNDKPYSNYLNYFRRKQEEFRVLDRASKIIATSTVTINDLQVLHPRINSKKFEYIPNGFENEITLSNITVHPKKKIIIGYVGSFYYTPESRDLIFRKWWRKRGHQKLQFVPRKEDWLYRSPYFVFKTVSELILKFPEYKEKIELRFAGKEEDWFKPMVNKFGLNSIVKHLGWISQDESLKFQKSCDFLLMTSAKVIGGRDYSVAGKTFEYFRMQKPILAFVTDGAQKDLLNESGLAHFVDVESIENGISQLITILTESITLRPNQTFIDSFKISTLTEKLVKSIHEAINEHK